MKNIALLLFLTLLLTSCWKTIESEVEISDKQETATQEDKTVKDIEVKEETKNENAAQIDQEDRVIENGNIIALMKTNFWDIKLEIYLDKVPMTATNFLVHAQNNYYDGVTFHRIINGFMIQGGDPDGTGMWGESIYWENFNDEFDPTLSNIPGTISMANRGPNTNGSQFFINQWNNINLDYNKQPLSSKHAVFGSVIEGMDVVEKIALVPTNPADNKPNDAIVIKDIQLFTLNEWKEVEYIIENIVQAKKQAIQKNKDLTVQKEEALKTKEAASWDTVWVKYRLTLNDGTLVDGNFDSDSVFDFRIDQPWIITGFSEAVKWMKIWDKKTVKLAAKDAYWEYDKNKTETVEKTQLQTFIDAWIKLEKWNVLPTPQGEFKIVSTTDTHVVIDVNHHLAGKELNFELELKYFVN